MSLWVKSPEWTQKSFFYLMTDIVTTIIVGKVTVHVTLLSTQYFLSMSASCSNYGSMLTGFDVIICPDPALEQVTMVIYPA